MATVMEWRSSSGKVERCDTKCHTARNKVCFCICGGRYHGVALKGGKLPDDLLDAEKMKLGRELSQEERTMLSRRQEDWVRELQRIRNHASNQLNSGPLFSE